MELQKMRMNCNKNSYKNINSNNILTNKNNIPNNNNNIIKNKNRTL